MEVLVLCVLLLSAAVSGQRADDEDEYYSDCPVPNGKFADAVQCDRYYECSDGVLSDFLCPDGLAFDDSGPFPKCEFLFRVNCTDRPELQPSQGTRNCKRANGYFEDPNSCFSFFFCSDGVPHPQNCPANLVFNPKSGTCTFADEAEREGCTTEDLIGFKCPSPPKTVSLFSPSRYNNPRFANSEDCRKYFVCIGGTKPREGSCGPNTVFNDVTKACDEPKNVPECRNYYGPIEEEEEEEKPPRKIHVTRKPGSAGPVVKEPTRQVVQLPENPFASRRPVEEKVEEQEVPIERRPVVVLPEVPRRPQVEEEAEEPEVFRRPPPSFFDRRPSRFPGNTEDEVQDTRDEDAEIDVVVEEPEVLRRPPPNRPSFFDRRPARFPGNTEDVEEQEEQDEVQDSPEDDTEVDVVPPPRRRVPLRRRPQRRRRPLRRRPENQN